jgi:iron-sulfur cluster insertion protein
MNPGAENESISSSVRGLDQTSQLVFSDHAANKVRALIMEEDNEDLRLRVFVSGGGCSGFEYGFTFDDEIEEDDIEIENSGVSLVVDVLSFEYLGGSSIDYLEDLQGSRFVVINPNATSTCGCGNSFSI